MGDEVTIVALDPRYCIARYRDILIQLWRTETPADGVDRAIAEIAAGPTVKATIVVISEGAAMPDPESRKRLDVLMKDLHPGCVCAAMVYEGTGFGAAAVRAIVTSLMLVVKQPFQNRIFSSVETGAAWMQRACPTIDGIGQLASVVTALRARIDGSPGLS